MQTTLRLRAAAVTLALIVLPSIGAGSPAGGASTIPPLFSALHKGDEAAVRVLTVRTVDVNAANAEGDTPLMYAAMYSTPPMVRLLLDRGANANAKTPAGTTALMLATGDIAKVRMLVAAGADVNAASVTGRTPLLIAASRGESGRVVRFLLAHGAKPNVKDELKGMPVLPVGSGGSTPLIEAAKIRDGQALRALLATGADVQARDNAGTDALTAAALFANTDNVKLLLEHGAKAESRVTMNQFTPLTLATWRHDLPVVKTLLAAGADPNAQDARGDSVLMWAAYNDYAETPVVEALLAAGAKVNTRNQDGDSALTWARKRGDTAVVRVLLTNGAVDEPTVKAVPYSQIAPADVRDAVAKSVALLQQSSPQFVKVSGCVSCHNQSLPQIVTAMARKKNIHVDEEAARQVTKIVLANIRPARLPLLEMADVVPDIAGTAGYLMLGLAMEGYDPDTATDAAALNLAAKQFPDGSWRPWAPRPPLEYSAITSTTLSLRALQLYGPAGRRDEFAERIANARAWLMKARPRTTEERAMRMLGLAWAGGPVADVANAAKALIASQREDGGWSQLPGLGSDAYATGQALYALRQVGNLSAGDPAYGRGARYLLSTQHEDGSWQVASRAFPFQPYKESGFPHGKDQWISAAGTSWAAMALMMDDRKH